MLKYVYHNQNTLEFFIHLNDLGSRKLFNKILLQFYSL